MTNRLDYSKINKYADKHTRRIRRYTKNLSRWDLSPSKERTPQFLINRHNGNIDKAYKDYCDWITKQRHERLTVNKKQVEKLQKDLIPPSLPDS